MAQGKTNNKIGANLGAAEVTTKKHALHIFEKLGLESRNAVSVIALKALRRR